MLSTIRLNSTPSDRSKSKFNSCRDKLGQDGFIVKTDKHLYSSDKHNAKGNFLKETHFSGSLHVRLNRRLLHYKYGGKPHRDNRFACNCSQEYCLNYIKMRLLLLEWNARAI